MLESLRTTEILQLFYCLALKSTVGSHVDVSNSHDFSGVLQRLLLSSLLKSCLNLLACAGSFYFRQMNWNKKDSWNISPDSTERSRGLFELSFPILKTFAYI